MPRPLGAILLSVLLFGASVPLAKGLLHRVDPWVLAGLLYGGSGLGLALLRGVGRRWLPAEAPLRVPDLPWLAGAVLAGGVAAPVLLMVGLRGTSAGAASLLLNLEALATMAIAWAGGREHPSLRIVVGAGLILAGSLLLSWQGGRLGFGVSSLLIAAACVCWAIDNTLTRRLSAADPVQIAMVKGLVAGGVNLSLGVWVLRAALPGGWAIGGAGAIGFAGYGVSLVLFILAMRDLGVARASAYFACAPFVGAVLSLAILHEPLSFAMAGAAVLMGVGVGLHLVERHSHAHTHETLEHEHPHVHDEHHLHAHGADDPPGEPHVHAHRHEELSHAHRHWPDLHHRHRHRAEAAISGE